MRKLAFVLVLFAITTVAVAGSSSAQQVSIWVDGSGQTAANGSLNAVRHSSDNVQYIGCSFYSYDTGGSSAVCYANSATGQYASCFTSDSQMLAVARTINPASYLYFVVNADGSCDRIITTSTSSNLP